MSTAVMTALDSTTNTKFESQPLSALPLLAARLRLDIIQMIYEAQSGHPGTSLSCIDILSYLWFHRMSHNPQQPDWADRDRFILSKGHGAPALYAVLMEAGYIPKEEIHTLRRVHSNLQGHPASKYVQGVDISTGSLGQGLSCAVGMALGHRLDKRDSRIFTLLGDGECQEGNVWEAVLSAAQHKVSAVTAIVDRNQLQIDGDTEKIKGLGDLGPKFEAFGWNVINHVDGHDFAAIDKAIRQADEWAKSSEKPTAIITKCTKGKGVSFMENQAGWHGKAPNTEQYEKAMAELREALNQLS